MDRESWSSPLKHFAFPECWSERVDLKSPLQESSIEHWLLRKESRSNYGSRALCESRRATRCHKEHWSTRPRTLHFEDRRQLCDLLDRPVSEVMDRCLDSEDRRMAE